MRLVGAEPLLVDVDAAREALWLEILEKRRLFDAFGHFAPYF